MSTCQCIISDHGLRNWSSHGLSNRTGSASPASLSHDMLAVQFGCGLHSSMIVALCNTILLLDLSFKAKAFPPSYLHFVWSVLPLEHIFWFKVQVCSMTIYSPAFCWICSATCLYSLIVLSIIPSCFQDGRDSQAMACHPSRKDFAEFLLGLKLSSFATFSQCIC